MSSDSQPSPRRRGRRRAVPSPRPASQDMHAVARTRRSAVRGRLAPRLERQSIAKMSKRYGHIGSDAQRAAVARLDGSAIPSATTAKPDEDGQRISEGA